MKKLSEKTLYEGKWLSLREKEFSNREKCFCWESVTRKSPRPIAIVIAKLIPSGKYIMIRQYRPSRERYVISFPAGFIEEGIEKCAIRELEEETGYKGKIRSISPPLAMNSGIGDDIAHFIFMDVPEKDNPQPKQMLEPEEDILVLLVSKEDIKDFLDTQRKEGYEIDAVVWNYFLGR